MRSRVKEPKASSLAPNEKRGAFDRASSAVPSLISPNGNHQLKYVAIAQTIEEAIRDGTFPSGYQLPSERELAQTYRVAYLTIRQSLALLDHKGLIMRKHGSGTFVRESLSHRHIAVLFGSSLQRESNHFYRSLMRALQAEGDHDHILFHVYDNLGGSSAKEGNWQNGPAIQRFLGDLQHYSFDGIIEVFPPSSWVKPQAIAHLPTIRLSDAYGQPDIRLDYARFTAESLAYLAKADKKRVVYLRSLPTLKNYTSDLDAISRVVRQLGIFQPRIEQFTHFRGVTIEREAYRRTEQLIRTWSMSGQWPDALLISDDIGARGATLALIVNLGAKWCSGFTVMAITNRGIEHHYGMPVVRYEFNPREIVHSLLKRLKQRISVPQVKLTPHIVAGRICGPLPSAQPFLQKRGVPVRIPGKLPPSTIWGIKPSKLPSRRFSQ